MASFIDLSDEHLSESSSSTYIPVACVTSSNESTASTGDDERLDADGRTDVELLFAQKKEEESEDTPPLPRTHSRLCCVPHFASYKCLHAWETGMLKNNVQVLVLSPGMGVSAVAAALLVEDVRSRFEQNCPPSSGLSFSTSTADSPVPMAHNLCVLLPDGTPPSLLLSIASSLQFCIDQLVQHEQRDGRRRRSGENEAAGPLPREALVVYPLTRGLSTKERCSIYERGGIVVGTGRTFCFDLLHRRLSPTLITMSVLLLTETMDLRSNAAYRSSVRTTGTFNFAFYTDILREGRVRERGGADISKILRFQAFGDQRVVLVADAPRLLQSLMQRHQRGMPRLVEQLHIGEMHLLPRFHTDVIDYYRSSGVWDEPASLPSASIKEERGERGERLRFKVSRVHVAPAVSVKLLDGLLSRILKEILAELHKVHAAEVNRERANPGVLTEGVGLGVEEEEAVIAPKVSWRQVRQQQRAHAAAWMDEIASPDYLPRSMDAKSLAMPVPPGKQGEQAGGMKAQNDFAYMRKPWRDIGNPSGIDFAWLDDDTVLNVEENELDADLKMAVQMNSSQRGGWPLQDLVYSLLDVRELKRVVHVFNPYEFLWKLEQTLRLSRGVGNGLRHYSAVPHAAWTLSSLVHDVMVVSSERIGIVETVKEGDSRSTTAAPPSNAHRSAAIEAPPPGTTGPPREKTTAVVHDVLEDGEEEVEVHPPLPTAAALPTASPLGLKFVPHPEHCLDPVLEVVSAMITSWARRVARSRSTSTSPQAMLVLVAGQRAVRSTTQRVCYGKEPYQQLQLNQFLSRYQGFHRREGRAAVDEAAPAPSRRRTMLSAAGRHQQKESAPASAAAASEEVQSSPTVASVLRRENFWCAASQHFIADADEVVFASDDEGSDAEDDEEEPWEDGEAPGKRKRSRGPPGPSMQAAAKTAAAQKRLKLEEDQTFLFSQAPAVKQEQCSGGGPQGRGATPSKPSAVSLHELLLQQPIAPLPPPSRLATEAACDILLLEPSVSVLQVHGGTAEQPCSASVVIIDDIILDERVLFELLARGVVPAREGAGGPTTAVTVSPITDVVFHGPSMRTMRLLETLSASTYTAAANGWWHSSTLRVRVLSTDITERSLAHQTALEREAFTSLAHRKATLSGTLLLDRDAVSAMGDELRAIRAIRSGSRRLPSLTPVQRLAMGPPRIIVDDREFRSLLPYAVHALGIDLVPLTLLTGDYVLSPSYVVERKSAQDFVQSVQSGRLNRQLAAMSRQYEAPLCLMEGSFSEPFRLVQSMSFEDSGSSVSAVVYQRTGALFARYPRVGFLWTRNPTHAAATLGKLKSTVAVENVDPSAPALTLSPFALEESEDGGKDGRASQSLAASRVLSCFPGVTPANLTAVMELCGSLAGLTTISRASLEGAMGEEAAEKLYKFLHRSFTEDVIE